MSRDPACILDILRACRNLARFTQGITFDQLLADEEKQSALIGQFVILGEAARRLSPPFCEAHAAIPWPKIISMRNQIAHGYDAINWPIVWQTIQHDIPVLASQLAPLVPPEQDEPQIP